MDLGLILLYAALDRGHLQSERGGLELQLANLKQREQSVIDEMADIRDTLAVLRPSSPE